MQSRVRIFPGNPRRALCAHCAGPVVRAMSSLLLDERTIPFDGVDEDFRDDSVEYEELMIEPVTPQDMLNSKGNKKMTKTSKEKPGRMFFSFSMLNCM